MTLALRAAALSLACCTLAACSVAYAAEPGFWDEVWAASRPQIVAAAASIVGLVLSILIGWLSLKAAATLKAVKDEKRALSLYRTIVNVLTMLIKTKVAQGQTAVLSGVPAGIVNDAMAIVRSQNAEAIEALGQTDEQLRTKVVAKLDEVQKQVAAPASAAR